ncbi:NAD(P)-dependent malic enzyme [Dethiobacter alkaliphilus]|uniref:Malate dehydrogenase (Oxaloacetate-decarboxylating) n=1 Tax=Dethiobacter alkaliphilus AHT 1 TaxID=555088 RepID=C0GKT9_DETAL|nr:NADP-dependent malic enzyme [Dethiobacter alkaliphilus]EEG76058.1 Malate dehydrogenase (oxaloacetate-decarboxylating) [Dethiobacter alkaliphilus AHT 1]
MDIREELIKKAEKPALDAMRLHPFYKGKIEVGLKCRVRDFNDFAIWYSPGVAEPCKAIAENKDLVYEHTNKGNVVAVVSDGTRVLGLGDIGPEASLPVMEGKALLFKYLGGVDAFPICVDTKDPDKLIEFVKMMQPTFGGINLEDIASPKCFYILERLRKECHIPVFHDDQQGTATVTLAGLINALRYVKKDLADVKIAIIGAGSANVSITNLIIAAGADPGKMFVADIDGILNKERAEELRDNNPKNYELAIKTNAEKRSGGTAEAMRDCDVVIALSQPGPGVIKKEWVQGMAKDPICFFCANPIPEMWPWEAKEAGAVIVATGRSDFANQVNNSVCFPGIFRGVLDVQASTITDEMCITAAYTIADLGAEGGIDPENLLPNMDNVEVFIRQAVSVGLKAIELGIARKNLSEEELRSKAEEAIYRARNATKMMMDEGFIVDPDKK